VLRDSGFTHADILKLLVISKLALSAFDRYSEFVCSKSAAVPIFPAALPTVLTSVRLLAFAVESYLVPDASPMCQTPLYSLFHTF